jgi:hypothetical protein
MNLKYCELWSTLWTLVNFGSSFLKRTCNPSFDTKIVFGGFFPGLNLSSVLQISKPYHGPTPFLNLRTFGSDFNSMYTLHTLKFGNCIGTKFYNELRLGIVKVQCSTTNFKTNQLRIKFQYLQTFPKSLANLVLRFWTCVLEKNSRLWFHFCSSCRLVS